jgi:hypothetical protein
MDIYDGYVLLGLYLVIANIRLGVNWAEVSRQFFGFSLVVIGQYFG